jgi:hypothetical protein
MGLDDALVVGAAVVLGSADVMGVADDVVVAVGSAVGSPVRYGCAAGGRHNSGSMISRSSLTAPLRRIASAWEISTLPTRANVP